MHEPQTASQPLQSPSPKRVTGELGKDRAIETLNRSASDHVLKSNLIRLVPASSRGPASAWRMSG